MKLRLHTPALALITLLLASPASWAVTHTATVLETMDSGGYTYARVKEAEHEFWIASPTSKVNVGDVIQFGEQMWMPGFTSKTMKRQFKELLFVAGFSKPGDTTPSAVNQGLPKVHPALKPPHTSRIKLSKAKDGYTIADLFTHKQELKGKTVTVHGQVVKVSPGIMGSNWIHIQDGTGQPGEQDVVFLSKTALPDRGDVVLASGTLATDKDFGFNYQYSVLVENASFKAQP